MKQLGKYSIGIGDRFGFQGQAQLQALLQARERGVEVTPVWNKSHREHTIVGTAPAAVRCEADAATAALGWGADYFVDADHIGLKNVDLFVAASDFFTLDVADFIGQPASEDDVRAFVSRHARYAHRLLIPGIDTEFEMTGERLEKIARKYLSGAREAGRIYRHITAAKGAGAFITEVSMDETDTPQTPEELFFILAMLAEEKIPVQTIAPKFTGRFNKGVDYTENVARFAREFEQDLCAIAFAVQEFGLPANLKLSVHSGSDKFSLYGPIRQALQKHNAGLHLKTAGTTWLEEVIGLAQAGGDGVAVIHEIFACALLRREELCQPYATVIDIDPARLPGAQEVYGWDGERFARALRHDPACPDYNPHLRQLIHVGYRIAAEMGAWFHGALERHEAIIARGVTENIYDRHLRQVFM